MNRDDMAYRESLLAKRNELRDLLTKLAEQGVTRIGDRPMPYVRRDVKIACTLLELESVELELGDALERMVVGERYLDIPAFLRRRARP